MYELIDRSGCQVHPQFLLDAHGGECLLVVVKASFSVDGDRLAPTNAVLELADRYHGDPTTSSLAAAGEVVLPRPRPDLLLSGTAYPVRPGDCGGLVSFRVGAWSKEARVHGDRVWVRGLGRLLPGEPEPFDAVPLRYERAFGGADLRADPPGGSLWNPVGVGQVPCAEGAALPNLEHPQHSIAGPDDRPPPCAFAPIPPHWEPRRSLHGTFDGEWRRTRMPLPPLDADPRAAHHAPPDQVYPGPLHGDEVVELLGVRPGGARLAFRLPGVRVRVTVHDGHAPRDLVVVLDALHVDADVPRLDLTWRACVAVQDGLDALEWVRVESLGGPRG